MSAEPDEDLLTDEELEELMTGRRVVGAPEAYPSVVTPGAYRPYTGGRHSRLAYSQTMRSIESRIAAVGNGGKIDPSGAFGRTPVTR